MDPMTRCQGILPIWAILLLALLWPLAGCSSGRPLHDVRGTVTLDGVPLAEGHISFDPADGVGGAQSGDIKDGEFFVKTEAGPKRVEIRASRPSKTPGPDGGPDFTQFLPARYNVKSELTTTIAPGKNRPTFALTMKP